MSAFLGDIYLLDPYVYSDRRSLTIGSATVVVAVTPGSHGSHINPPEPPTWDIVSIDPADAEVSDEDIADAMS